MVLGTFGRKIAKAIAKECGADEVTAEIIGLGILGLSLLIDPTEIIEQGALAIMDGVTAEKLAEVAFDGLSTA